MATATVHSIPATETIPVVRKHHWLVRLTHWLNIPFLLGLGLSGLSIYAISPGLPPRGGRGRQHGLLRGHWPLGRPPRPRPAPLRRPRRLVLQPLQPRHGLLAPALRLHWLFAYLFMANGLLYLIGLAVGGGWRSLTPRRTDLREAWKMQVYYVGLPFAKTSAPPLAAPRNARQVQRPPAPRLRLHAPGRPAVGADGLGDPQARRSSAGWRPCSAATTTPASGTSGCSGSSSPSSSPTSSSSPPTAGTPSAPWSSAGPTEPARNTHVNHPPRLFAPHLYLAWFMQDGLHFTGNLARVQKSPFVTKGTYAMQLNRIGGPMLAASPPRPRPRLARPRRPQPRPLGRPGAVHRGPVRPGGPGPGRTDPARPESQQGCLASASYGCASGPASD